MIVRGAASHGSTQHYPGGALSGVEERARKAEGETDQSID
jgi:hypothetical protein